MEMWITCPSEIFSSQETYMTFVEINFPEVPEGLISGELNNNAFEFSESFESVILPNSTYILRVEQGVVDFPQGMFFPTFHLVLNG